MSKVPCQFAPNFLSYVSAKSYLNWFTVGKIITKIKKVNFLLRHSLGVTVFTEDRNESNRNCLQLTSAVPSEYGNKKVRNAPQLPLLHAV